MPGNFGSRVFTPIVKELQERYGSRHGYERYTSAATGEDAFSEFEIDFLSRRDSFYMATVGSTGWPYVQHRGGPAGFVKVLDPQTIAFADYRGNKQYVSTGNLSTDDRVAMIFVDYPNQARMKILGRVKIIDREHAGKTDQFQPEDPKTPIERIFVIHVEAFDWNCPKHITPRYTAEEIRAVLAPFEIRMQKLEEENERLRRQIASDGSPSPAYGPDAPD